MCYNAYGIKSPSKRGEFLRGVAKIKKVRTRKRGRTWSYIFEAGVVNGKRKVVEKGGFEKFSLKTCRQIADETFI